MLLMELVAISSMTVRRALYRTNIIWGELTDLHSCPADIPIKRNIPILFQDLKIDNRLIHSAKEECIDKHLSYKPNIQLKHYQNSFSISFAAPDYCEHGRVHYHYMLENFDKKDWITSAGNNHEAYYANLPSGNILSRLKSQTTIRVLLKPKMRFK